MNPVSAPSRKLAVEQARTIRAAQAGGRSLLAWSATLADGTTIVVFASTDRAARTVAAAGGTSVVRVGPAAVRDMAGAIARALASVPPAAPRSVAAPVAAPAPVSSRDKRRDWLASGEGPRPVFSSPAVVRRVAGEPRRVITARCRPGADAPLASDYSLNRNVRPVRVAHESRPVHAYVPVYRPEIPLFSVA